MISDKFNRDENPDWEPDALVEVTFSARTTVAKNGYRPHYKVAGDYLTTTLHWFIDSGEAKTNQPTQAFVKLITPEAYPNCLESGMLIEVGEGSCIIGTAKIIEVYNEILRSVS